MKPTSPGYATYSIEPQPGTLKWIQGSVPTPGGAIEVYCSDREIKVKGAAGIGTLRFKSKKKPSSKGGKIIDKGDGAYEMLIEKDVEYIVSYSL